MHILLLSTEYPPHQGGIASHVYELARAFAHHHGAKVSVFAPPIDDGAQADFDPFDDDKIHVYRPKWLLTGKPFYDWSLQKWLRDFIEKNAHTTPVDIIHVHGLKPLGATAFIKRDYHIPVVFTNHSSGFLKKLNGSHRTQAKVKRQMAHLAHVLAPSQELIDATYALGYRGESTFISNGVDEQKFYRPASSKAREKLRHSWGVDKDDVLVLLARRLHKKNGVGYLAESAQYLQDSKIVFVIAGEGDQKTAMQNHFEMADMDSRVVWLGGIPNSEMPNVYNGCDISVLPSLMEATSITGLESMACHLPLVGTRVGGIPHLVDDGVSGLLVEPRDPKSLAVALAMLSKNKAKRLAMGTAGRHRVEKLFSWSQIAKQTMTVFQNLQNQQEKP